MVTWTDTLSFYEWLITRTISYLTVFTSSPHVLIVYINSWIRILIFSTSKIGGPSLAS